MGVKVRERGGEENGRQCTHKAMLDLEKRRYIRELSVEGRNDFAYSLGSPRRRRNDVSGSTSSTTPVLG